MKRIEVYQILDGERDYQDEKWTESNALSGVPDEKKSLSDWIEFMKYHIDKANNCVDNIDQQGALAEIRKITALGVVIMELFGCPEREGYERLLNSTYHPRSMKYIIPVGDISDDEINRYITRIAEKFKTNITLTTDDFAIIPNSDITFPEKKCDCKTPCSDDSCDCGDTQHDCNCKE